MAGDPYGGFGPSRASPPPRRLAPIPAKQDRAGRLPGPAMAPAAEPKSTGELRRRTWYQQGPSDDGYDIDDESGH